MSFVGKAGDGRDRGMKRNTNDEKMEARNTKDCGNKSTLWEKGVKEKNRVLEGAEKKEGGEGREMVKSEENAPSPPGYARSSRPGPASFFFDKRNFFL